MRHHQAIKTKILPEAKVSLLPYANFLFSIDYKGEKCYKCGHRWDDKGVLHFKHCSFYVSPQLASIKKH